MEQTQIARLFGLFAGDDTLGETYGAVLETAVLEVEQALRPDADAADARLNWLAAAVGFLRYTQITAARDRAACTFAGTVAQNTDGSQKLRFAELLVQHTRTCVTPCWKRNRFCFWQWHKKGGERNAHGSAFEKGESGAGGPGGVADLRCL